MTREKHPVTRISPQMMGRSGGRVCSVEDLPECGGEVGGTVEIGPVGPDHDEPEGPQSVLAALLTEQDFRRSTAVLHCAVELDHRIGSCEVEVHSTDEAVRVVELCLQDRLGESVLVQEHPHP